MKYINNLYIFCSRNHWLVTWEHRSRYCMRTRSSRIRTDVHASCYSGIHWQETYNYLSSYIESPNESFGTVICISFVVDECATKAIIIRFAREKIIKLDSTWCRVHAGARLRHFKIQYAELLGTASVGIVHLSGARKLSARSAGTKVLIVNEMR